jgi:hypothetical protein
MANDLLHRLIGQLDGHWQFQLRPRLEGLTDDEYYWEPAPDCWTVRRMQDGRFVPDWAPQSPEPPPFTTIAWRICHMAGPCLDIRVRELLRGETIDYENYPWPGDATDALALLDSAYASWRDGIRALGEDGLWRNIGPAAGPYADSPWFEMITHNNREIIHHGAEVALLRDLYRARGGKA